MIELGETIYFSLGSEKNIKLTTTDDIDILKALLFQKNQVG
jgi:2-C-methyl-D-erythritol 4-phosphate cytidylyltransferase